MILKTPWSEYRVHVQHGKDADGHRFTQMRMHDGPCQNSPCDLPTPLRATASLHPKDVFVKIKGNKIAFGRLVAAFDRKARGILWGEFWKNHKRPR